MRIDNFSFFCNMSD